MTDSVVQFGQWLHIGHIHVKSWRTKQNEQGFPNWARITVRDLIPAIIIIIVQFYTKFELIFLSDVF